jgi:hypothetical protein
MLLAALWGGSSVFMRVAVPAMGPFPSYYGGAPFFGVAVAFARSTD